jgi:PAS domain S-box-containing protein
MTGKKTHHLPSENRLQRMAELISASIEGIAVLDTEGVVVFANPAAETLLGKTPGGAAGCYLGYPSADGTPSEITIRRGEADLLQVEMRSTQTFWEDKPAFVVNLHDVTSSRMAEQVLRKSEEKYRLLFENATVGFDISDTTGQTLAVNRAMGEMTGYSPESVLHVNFTDTFVHPEERTRFMDTRTRDGGVKDFEGMLKRADGLTYWATLSSKEILYDGKKAFLTTALDISRRKEMEKQRHLAVRILKLLNRSAADKDLIKQIIMEIKNFSGMEAVGIRLKKGEDYPYYETNGFPEFFVEAERYLCVRDPEGEPIRDTSGSPVLECMCGNVICGRTDPAFPFFTKAGTFWSNCTTDLLRSTTEGDRQARTRNRCNGEGYESVALIPLLTPEGNIGLIQLNDHRRDMFTPQQIRLYEELGESIGIALAGKRAKEAQKALQDQFSQAQKMESVGRLAGGVAHDFNNKLTSILGYTELAMRKLDPSDALYGDLTEVLNAGEQAAGIINQLLAFARKQTISPKVMALNDSVEGMLKMLRRLIGENIDLVWEPGTDLWRINMDPNQVDQILANLCVNAKDAINGVGKVTVETRNVLLDKAYCAEHEGFVPGQYVLLAVSDDGTGMDKETLERALEPFFTTKEQGKGTGLGLSTVYGIVKQNHGFLHISSEPGRGTTVNIYLPRSVADEAADKEVPEKKAPAGGNETILVVEDDPTILRMTRMMLEKKGYAVLSAASPAEAMEQIKKHSCCIDLLLTDVVLPEMNGRALAGQISALYPDIRLLFMSGYTADVIAHQGVLDAGVAFIQKPFSMTDMTEKVRKVLDSASLKVRSSSGAS